LIKESVKRTSYALSVSRFFNWQTTFFRDIIFSRTCKKRETGLRRGFIVDRLKVKNDIEDSPEEVRQMLSNTDPEIAKAEAILEHLGSLDEVRRYYEAREMAIHDEITRMNGARKEGREEGRLEGEEEGRVKTAKNLLLMGLDVETVAKGTELPVAKIVEIQKSLLN
jgi:predicted transposase/invertase (TIGR01784 family)